MSTEEERLLYRPAKAVAPNRNANPSAPNRRLRRPPSRDGYVDSEAEYTSDDVLFPKKKTKKSIKTSKAMQRGRKWDHLRSAEPVIVPSHTMRPDDSRWRDFMEPSGLPRRPVQHSGAQGDILDRLYPGFNDKGALPTYNARASIPSKTLHERLSYLFLRNAMLPSILRLVVLLTSIISLGTSANIYAKRCSHLVSDSDVLCNLGLKSQTRLSIAIDVLVTPYVLYMTYDEYTRPQIGLRSAMLQMFLTLLDIVFIVLKSASATLAIESSLQQTNPSEIVVLAVFLLIGLIGWIMNLSVSVLRVVQRLGGLEQQRRAG